MRFFTADTHFNHPIIADMRSFSGGMGFVSFQEHDEYIIKMWNAYVGKKDEVYHLGDFCFGAHEIVRSIRARLNGKIHLIMGNHDYSNRINNIPGQFTSINDIKTIKFSKKGCPLVTLCHYAMRVWGSSHYNSWQLYGHSHGKLPPQGKQWDVGLDNNQFRLLMEQDIIEIMDKQPDNFKLIKI
jgi:calcineurin-like phosphoesterase family protein